MKKSAFENMKKTINSVSENRNMLNSGELLKTISPSEIICNDFNSEVFREMNSEEFSRLVASIEQVGLLTPLTVTKTEEGYRLISGHMRLKALKHLGIDKVPVKVVTLSEEDEKIALIHANIAQRKLNDIDFARAIQHEKKIIQEKIKKGEISGKTHEILAEKFDTSPATIKRMDRLNKLIPELQALVENNEIATTKAADIALLDPETQQFLFDSLRNQLDQLSQKEIQEIRKKETELLEQLQKQSENQKNLAREIESLQAKLIEAHKQAEKNDSETLKQEVRDLEEKINQREKESEEETLRLRKQMKELQEESNAEKESLKEQILHLESQKEKTEQEEAFQRTVFDMKKILQTDYQLYVMAILSLETGITDFEELSKLYDKTSDVPWFNEEIMENMI